jgi:hypothetical protein
MRFLNLEHRIRETGFGFLILVIALFEGNP